MKVRIFIMFLKFLFMKCEIYSWKNICDGNFCFVEVNYEFFVFEGLLVRFEILLCFFVFIVYLIS